MDVNVRFYHEVIRHGDLDREGYARVLSDETILVLLQSEIEYLNKIMMYLDIAPADAQFLIKAMLIKNRV